MRFPSYLRERCDECHGKGHIIVDYRELGRFEEICPICEGDRYILSLSVVLFLLCLLGLTVCFGFLLWVLR